MKLSELEPLLDRRRPLRFAGPRTELAVSAPTSAEPTAEVVVTAPGPVITPMARRSALSPEDLPAEADIDPASLHDILADLRRSVTGFDEAPEQLEQLAHRLHRRPRSTGLRARAHDIADHFTGAATGALVALLASELDVLRARLHARTAAEWQHLLTVTGTTDSASPLGVPADASPGATPETEGIRSHYRRFRSAWQQRDQCDELADILQTDAVFAMSPHAHTAATHRRVEPVARLERSFASRRDWGSGVAFLPGRRVLLVWGPLPTPTGGRSGGGRAEAIQLQLFEIDAAELARWARSLSGDDAVVPEWRRWIVPAKASLSDRADWTAPVVELSRLMMLGQGPTPIRRTSTGTPKRSENEPTPAVTRLVISAAEAVDGIPPVDLATGYPSTAPDWLPARFRSAWSPEQRRYVRTWVDTHHRDDKRLSHGSVLVTVLPATPAA